MKNIITQLESYITDYVALADPGYCLPIALWIVGTFCYPEFDSYPYLVITSPTKRSGKTRLAELISFTCSNPRSFAAMTGPTMFRAIETEKPTIIFDEAEALSSESASTIRSVLNVGYRKGQVVPRTAGATIKEFQTYCPKIFILIGDVNDTLKDRSVIVTMRRSEPKVRFTYEACKERGAAIRSDIDTAVKSKLAAITEAFVDHSGLTFLMDRDEEIWTSLFVLCGIFCPDRIKELQRSAVDMATEKTGESRKYTKLRDEEDAALDDQYAQRLVLDLYGLFVTYGGNFLATATATELLKDIPTAPWRKFKGVGLTQKSLQGMLSRFKIHAKYAAIGSRSSGRKILKAYSRKSVEEAVTKL